ncbi:hypothetical protein CGSMWGv6420B_05271 [Gardnerella vaginalis 6420B]|nr:hypothetical protein CGSMWGv6420B_05271 [Gardnerella vaginalis 6420B]
MQGLLTLKSINLFEKIKRKNFNFYKIKKELKW